MVTDGSEVYRHLQRCSPNKENNIWVNTANINEGEGGGLPNTLVRHMKGEYCKLIKANQSKKSNKDF